MRPTGPETSVRKYHYLVRKNPEERSSQPLRGGSLKSRVVFVLVAMERALASNIGDTVRFLYATLRCVNVSVADM